MKLLKMDSPIGILTLLGSDTHLHEIRFGDAGVPASPEPGAVLLQAKAELEEYFSGKRTCFSVPFLPQRGTDFQRKCWDALYAVPYGCTITYGQLAALAGFPGAARAAGGACHVNPIPIIVPCHRVIAAGGKIGGFAGGLAIKNALLALERQYGEN